MASHLLQRHPIAMEAGFEHVLVLTYAIPATTLQPLLPSGLSLDTFQDYGFLAIAMVQTRGMRPRFAPSFLGNDFFLTGYRVFTRYRTLSGRTLRGLRILRSDTDSAMMVRWGNRLTHYAYRQATVDCRVSADLLEIDIRTPEGEADLHVRAHLAEGPAPLPDGSPFTNLQIARRYAGPLPFTFDYEPETHSIIRIQGVRDQWHPASVRVEVVRNTFLQGEPFSNTQPVLASAFHLANVAYRWKRGVREALED